MICDESTTIANREGFLVSYSEMIARTKEVIRETASNESSMLQSVKNRKRTEIDAINGVLVTIGKKHHTDVTFNELLIYLITALQPIEK